MRNINYKKIVIVFFLLCFFIFPLVNNVEAGNLKQLFESGLNKTAGDNGAGYKVYSELDSARLEGDLAVIIGWYIWVALSLVGVIFLILLIYGGFKWMFARGNDSEVQKAKDIIINSGIGLIIIIAAYAISYFAITFFDLMR